MAAYKSGAVAPVTNEIVYKDLGLGFISHPVTKKLTVLKNENSLKRAIKNLILTNYYERFYNPFFGGNITSYLFENFSPGIKSSIEKSIQDAIEVYEPRVEFVSSNVETNVDQNELRVEVIFRPLNQATPVEFNFTIERIR